MKLVAAIKLLPTDEQARVLEDTLKVTNRAANTISEIAWQRKSFGQYKLHKLTYYEIKDEFQLTAQVVVRTIAKVADAYKLDKKTKRTFKSLGAVAYDDRILRFHEDAVSIWTVAGRQHISFVCAGRFREALKCRRGQSDLVFKGGKWYLFITVNVEEPSLIEPEDWLGIDLGIKNIAADSDGESYCGKQLKGLRHRYARIRSRLQTKGTKSAKRLLKKRRSKERRMARDINHQVSKKIVRKAQGTKRGISLEDLTGIRARVTVKKSQRRTVHSWSFGQLRQFVGYKAKFVGIPVLLVDPRNTSRTCPNCGHVDKRNRPAQDSFSCVSCSFAGDADTVAAENIRRAAVNQPDVVCGNLPHNHELTTLSVSS